MDVVVLIGIVAIIIGYLNLFLLLKKDKPIINIYNQIPGLTKYNVASSNHNITKEIPIDSIIAVKDIKGDVNLDSEKLSSSSVSELTEKIKNIRSK